MYINVIIYVFTITSYNVQLDVELNMYRGDNSQIF